MPFGPVTLIFYWPSFQALRWRKYQYSSSLRYLLMEAWIHFEQWIGFVILLEIRACWKINLARCMYISTPIYRDYGIFPLLIANPWISLCHSQFYVLYWHFSSPLYQFFVWCLLTCHNDAGHNNRLFDPGTDMDRERLRLSHLQNVGLVE